MSIDKTPLTLADLIKGATLLVTIIAAVSAVVWQLAAVREELAGLRAELVHVMNAQTLAGVERARNSDLIHAIDKRVIRLEAQP